MISSSAFWKTEAEAPLLNRNAGFVTLSSSSSACTRAKNFLPLIEAKAGCPINVTLLADCHDAAALRIFRLDAERTFSDPANCEEMVKTLQTLWHEFKDYHQGLGFIVAFLLLYLDAQEVAQIAVGLDRHYIPGYFKAAAANYVRDAKVYAKLISQFVPSVAFRLEEAVAPEAFCSKWFIGLCVHVLPFRALMDFLEAFFEKGELFLFQFGVALVRYCEIDILATKDVGKLLAILRLDVSVYPDNTKAEGDDQEGSFFTKLVEEAINLQLTDIDLEKMRAEVTEEMRLAEERRKQREHELGFDSDDEIVFSDEEEDGKDSKSDTPEDEKDATVSGSSGARTSDGTGQVIIVG